jgi:peptidoglycan/xylan/chitin deacetylase (PgdA/CDA1 family)
MNRRRFLACGGAAAAGALSVGGSASAERAKAQIAITFDLEMSRNFPTWDQTHWDYEKGNLDEATKRYAVEAARRVKAHGGAMHFFVVGRVLEQENVEWLKRLAADGHPLGNHTYDHVNIKASRAGEIQPRFQRAPWLIAGREPAEIIRENIRLCSAAMESRLGIAPVGFRTPGGFANGLEDAPERRAMLRELGFAWCSSKYPPTAALKPGAEPDAAVLEALIRAQAAAQPFRYKDGLVEIPMSPLSDIGAFRNGRWNLEWFLKTTRLAVEWAIEHRAVFDFLAHPSCLGVVDPEFRTIELICELVAKHADRAAFATLDQVAAGVEAAKSPHPD